MKQLIAPNGQPIVGTLENLSARADVNGWEINEAGELEPVWAGDTEVFWDGQVTVTREVDGKPVTVCLTEDGDEFLLTDCKIVDASNEDEDEDEDDAA
jgi:hypothetical protein